MTLYYNLALSDSPVDDYVRQLQTPCIYIEIVIAFLFFNLNKEVSI